MRYRYRIEAPGSQNAPTGYAALYTMHREAIKEAQRMTAAGLAPVVMIWDMAALMYIHTERATK